MSTDVAALLARTTLVVRSGRYALGAWRHAESPAVHAGMARADGELGFVLFDDIELSALVPEATLDELPTPQKIERDFAALTLDTVMAWDVVGVLAHVTALLAGAGIPLGAATAYSRDHLLVPGAQLERALEVLAPHFESVRGRA